MAIGQSNAGPDTSCKCKQLPILDTGMYLNGMPPIDLQCHSTLHRALNFALNCECIARAHTPKYRSHSAMHSQFKADRKSTRLNSSHTVISYAVFCLKKKKNKHNCRLC